MKSRIVLFAFCVALLSSCGNKGNDTGKVPEYAVQELQKTTANLTTAYPANGLPTPSSGLVENAPFQESVRIGSFLSP